MVNDFYHFDNFRGKRIYNVIDGKSIVACSNHFMDVEILMKMISKNRFQILTKSDLTKILVMLLMKLQKTPLKIQPTHYRPPHHTNNPVPLSALQVHARIRDELKIFSSSYVPSKNMSFYIEPKSKRNIKSLEFLFWSLLW